MNSSSAGLKQYGYRRQRWGVIFWMLLLLIFVTCVIAVNAFRNITVQGSEKMTFSTQRKSNSKSIAVAVSCGPPASIYAGRLQLKD
jgi:fatty acid desaturase